MNGWLGFTGPANDGRGSGRALALGARSKKALCVLCSFVLAFSLLGASFWQQTQTAQADPAGVPSKDVTLTIKAGAATPVEGLENTYCFPNLSVATNPPGTRFSAITVQFTTGITAGDEIYYNANHEKNNGTALPAGFTRFAGNKTGNRSVNYTVDGGATAEQWQEFLRSHLTISLADKTNTKGLRIVASLSPVSITRDYNSLNGHYYEVGTINGSVDTSKTWSQALAEAEKHTYMGMKGYLVTVTNRAEQDFVYSLVHADTWMGGTCDYTYTNREGAWAKNYPGYDPAKTTRWATQHTNPRTGVWWNYYWVSGPEAGLHMGDCYNYANRTPAVNPENGEEMFMFWASAQPDGPASTAETAMQLAVNFGTTASDRLGQWNDLPENYGGLKYVIEYGGMPGDGEGDAEADVDVDVYVKVDIMVDPTGRTITTEANDVVVGQPLDITENVNGGDVITVLSRDENGIPDKMGPATITRDYYRLESGSVEHNTAVWSPQPIGRSISEDGGKTWKLIEGQEPAAAGTYKVIPSATYSTVQSDIDAARDQYESAGQTFKITPLPIDPTTPAAYDEGETPDPVTGEDGSQVVTANRTYGKPYDGSKSFDPQNKRIDLSDLVPGAVGNVWLEFDSGCYAQSGTGMQDLVLTGVRLAGPDAGSYTLPGVITDPATGQTQLVVKGAITPRTVELTPRFSADGSWPANLTWITGVPFADPSNPSDPNACHNDVLPLDPALYQVQPDGVSVTGSIANVLDNMLLEQRSLQQLLESQGCTIEYSAKTLGGLPLDREHPQPASYVLTAAITGPGVVHDAATGTYVVGDYRFHVNPVTLAVTPRPAPVQVTLPTETVDPGSDPIAPEDVIKHVTETYDPEGTVPGTPGGTPGTKPGLPDTDPTVTITKGGKVVEEIDPDEPGTYIVTVSYPDPNGQDVEVTYEVVVNPPAPSGPPSVNRDWLTVGTFLRGDVGPDSTITATRTVPNGTKDVKVSWTPGAGRYVASVEIDGKTVDASNLDHVFSQVSESHEVVVTIARMPLIGNTVVNGWHMLTVNTYGKGVSASPSKVVDRNQPASATWTIQPGYQLVELLVDGKPVTESGLAGEVAIDLEKGTVTIASMTADHVVDVRVAKPGQNPELRQDDLMVTTKIEGGPGSITGGATVAPGESYEVAWNTVFKTTDDVASPEYGVYQVESVTVNGRPAAGPDDAGVTLHNIRSDQNVVVKVKPLLHDINVVAVGPGTATGSATLFRGQNAPVAAQPDEDAYIYAVVVDGELVYSLSADQAAQSAEAQVDQQQAGSQSAQALSAPSTAADGDGVAAQSGSSEAPKASDAADAADAVDGAEPSDAAAASSEGAAGGQQAAAVDRIDQLPALNGSAATENAGGVRQAAAVVPFAGSDQAAFAPERFDYAKKGSDQLAATLNSIQGSHLVKVYFAKKGADGQIDPDAVPEVNEPSDLDPIDQGMALVTTRLDGCPGSVLGGGMHDVDRSNSTTIRWNLAPGYEPKELWVNGMKVADLTPDSTEHVLSDLRKGQRYDVVVVAQKSLLPGNENSPVVEQNRFIVTTADKARYWNVTTQLTGGLGTISASAQLVDGSSYTVTWAPEPGYRVAKVLVDGVEMPSLLATDHVTFEGLFANHTVQVILEKIPDETVPPLPQDPEEPAQPQPSDPVDPEPDPGDEPSGPAQGGTQSGLGAAQDGGEQAQLAKTGDANGVVPAAAACVLAACIALLAGAWRRKQSR